MNGAYAQPLTAPPAFAGRQSRGDSKECCRPALLFREGEFPWTTRKPTKSISSADTTPFARLLSAMPGSVRPCRNYVELHIILLHFPAFYDTILILRKLTAENNRWNINKIANILPMKTQRIHPHIIGFVEFEWWECRRAMWFILCRAITLSLRHRKIRPCISRCGVLFLSSGLSFPCLI